MRQGLRIDANYSEDVVGFALESFQTLLSFPRHRFSIEPFSRGKKRGLGADSYESRPRNSALSPIRPIASTTSI
jgi:hypothetical protein